MHNPRFSSTSSSLASSCTSVAVTASIRCSISSAVTLRPKANSLRPRRIIRLDVDSSESVRLPLICSFASWNSRSSIGALQIARELFDDKVDARLDVARRGSGVDAEESRGRDRRPETNRRYRRGRASRESLERAGSTCRRRAPYRVRRARNGARHGRRCREFRPQRTPARYPCSVRSSRESPPAAPVPGKMQVPSNVESCSLTSSTKRSCSTFPAAATTTEFGA